MAAGNETETLDDLIDLIKGLSTKSHDYNSSAEAMVTATVAVFEFMGRSVGATGFQGDWASLEILRKIKRIKGPFGIVSANNMLYPQYNEVEKVKKWQKEWAGWLKDEAVKSLEDPGLAVLSVTSHWKSLVQNG